MSARAIVVGAALAVVSGALACGSSKTAAIAMQVPEGVSPRASAAAVDTYRTRCAPCHGRAGEGDGPASPALVPKPRDFGQAAWQQSISDEQIELAIVDGGVAIGLSAVMPANPDLHSRPQVVRALRIMIRGFSRP